MKQKKKVTKKSFDCVEMKHRAQEKLSKELEGLSQEERLRYYQRRHEELIAQQKALRESGAHTT